jgi:CRP/FNR family cyclic AMP-dependent transcriptional regulator
MGLDIADMEIFSDLNIRRKAQLRQAAVLHDFKKGQFIYMPGDPTDTVYIVAEGNIKTSKISESGKELTLSYNGPGDMFGELAVLEERPRRTAAIALSESKVWAIPSDELMQIALSASAFALRLGTIIGQRRRELENRMENLVFRDVPERLAHQLVLLADKHGVEKNGRIEITFRISQLELANLIGATRETTSTAINELKRLGILDTSHRKIVIKDYKALKDLEGSL